MQRGYWKMLLAILLCAGVAIPGGALAQEPPPPADDEAIRALIQEAGTTGDNDGASRVTVFHRTTVDVEDTGLSHIREHRLVKCLTEQGAAELARLRLDYDPASNMVRVDEIRIHRASGDIEKVSLDDAVDLPQPQWAIYWGARMKLIPLPRLHVGDAVEIRTYMKGYLIAYLDEEGNPQGSPDTASGAAGAGEDERYIPPMRGHFYDIVYFRDDHPVKLRHYTVTLPRDKPLQYEIYNGEVKAAVTWDDTHHVYRFWREDLPAYHSEPHAVDHPDVQTKVVMATVPDWPAKSRWFYEVNEDQFEATEAIRDKVEEITAGLDTDEQKIAAIVHWSANEIRYSGISMGEGEGYTLHPGAMIFRDRSGVCKDKAGMAITMLKAAGFEVYPAMTMAGSRVERIPADQFNHCVVALRDSESGEFRMLDPTWVVFSPELWSSAEGEQHFVVGTPQGDVLRVMPAFDPRDNRLVVEAESEILPDGTLEGEVTFSGKGYADQRLRRELVHYHSAADRRAWFEAAIGALGPGAEVEPEPVEYETIQDVTTPISYTVRYRVPGYARVVDDTLIFSPPTARHLVTTSRLAPYLDAADLEERTQPLLLWAPRMRDVTETIRLPRGYQVAHLPEDRSIGGDMASLETGTEARRRRLEYHQQLVIADREIPVEAYPEFREVVTTAHALSDDPVVLEKR